MVKRFVSIAKGVIFAACSKKSTIDTETGMFKLNVFKGGQLKGKIGLDNILKVKYLKISGIINIVDLYFIQYMDNLEVLDLSEVIYQRKRIHEKGKLELRKSLLRRKRCLRTIYLPEFIGYIPNNFFSDCKNLEQVIISKSVKIIGWNAFSGSGIKKIVIPKSVQRIDHGAFDNCNRLEKVVVEDGKRHIVWKGVQFDNCPSLKKVYIGRNSKLDDNLVSHQSIDELKLGKFINNINFDFPRVNKVICEMRTPPVVSEGFYKGSEIEVMYNYDLFWVSPGWNKIMRRNNP